MRTIGDEWQSYLETVVPKGASDTQTRETRYAFMAGAFSIMQLLKHQSDDDALACASDCEEQMAMLVQQRLHRSE